LHEELGIGLLVVAATPSSLASAAVWTRRTGGNDVVAMLISVVTNLSCFLATPVWLKWTTGRAVLMDGLMINMMSKLGLLVVLPMILAQLIRLLPPIDCWGTLRKKPLGVLAQLGGLLMVWLGSIKVGQELSTAPLGKGPETLDFVGMLLAVVVIHLAMVAAGHGLGRLAGFSHAD
jgi:sodium/bile acid cotransporter 7